MSKTLIFPKRKKYWNINHYKDRKVPDSPAPLNQKSPNIGIFCLEQLDEKQVSMYPLRIPLLVVRSFCEGYPHPIPIALCWNFDIFSHENKWSS